MVRRGDHQTQQEEGRQRNPVTEANTTAEALQSKPPRLGSTQWHEAGDARIRMSTGLLNPHRQSLPQPPGQSRCSPTGIKGHPQPGPSDKPPITRSEADLNVCMLLEKTQEAQEKLEVLDEADCTKSDAQEAWDWVFQSDGFFEEIDEDDDDNGDDSGSKSKSAGLITSIPRRPVDHRGGGRLG